MSDDKKKIDKKKNENHYVDNKEFFVAMSEWKNEVNEANGSEEPRPPINEYIGSCFLKIAQHLCYRPNFIKYPFKEEMIGDGVENCLMYAHNFDPEKSKNPFSYFTQIIYYAFLRRIQKEKKQNYIKYKMLELKDVDGTHKKWYKENYFADAEKEVKDPYAKILNLTETDIENFTPKKKKTKKKTKKVNKKESNKLEKFMDDE
jgi:hypothetical protein|tara:strand:- start:1205 stop:1813 length:609 start_codon:yes stop_codon:yes gene_type:complete